MIHMASIYHDNTYRQVTIKARIRAACPIGTKHPSPSDEVETYMKQHPHQGAIPERCQSGENPCGVDRFHGKNTLRANRLPEAYNEVRLVGVLG